MEVGRVNRSEDLQVIALSDWKAQVKVKVLGCTHSSDLGQAVHPGQLLSSLDLDQVLSAGFFATSLHLLHGNNLNYFVALLKFK